MTGRGPVRLYYLIQVDIQAHLQLGAFLYGPGSPIREREEKEREREKKKTNKKAPHVTIKCLF